MRNKILKWIKSWRIFNRYDKNKFYSGMINVKEIVEDVNPKRASIYKLLKSIEEQMKTEFKHTPAVNKDISKSIMYTRGRLEDRDFRMPFNDKINIMINTVLEFYEILH